MPQECLLTHEIWQIPILVPGWGGVKGISLIRASAAAEIRALIRSFCAPFFKHSCHSAALAEGPQKARLFCSVVLFLLTTSGL